MDPKTFWCGRPRGAVLFVPLLVLAAQGCGGGSSGQEDAGLGDAALADVQDAGPNDVGSTDRGETDAALPSPTLPEELPNPLPQGTPNVTVVSFNTGLAPTLRVPSQRLPLILNAVKQVGADVICLNEVWTVYTSPWAFAQEVATVYPYAFWHERGTTPMGSGLLILSKHPLYRGRALAYEAQELSDYFEKSLIAADVVTENAYFHVMCTHLAAPTDETGPPLRKAQLDEAKAFAAANGYLSGVTFFLGDFNAGPDPVQDCTPTTDPPCRLPDVESYDYALQTWTDPNHDWEQCTWCRSIAMPFQISATFSQDPSQRIDHCLYRGLAAENFKSRSVVFDEKISISAGSITIEHLSDHIGVKCVFGP